MSEITEWKTIRIDAGSYYKLNELSGLFTFVLGSQTTLSAVARCAIFKFYLEACPELTKLITNPDELKLRRENMKKSTLEMVKGLDEDVIKMILDGSKQLNDRERDD